MENWFNAMANKQTIKELIADDNKFYYICLDCGKTTNKLNKDITEMLETIKKTGGLIKKHKRD